MKTVTMSVKRFYFLEFVGMPQKQYVYGLTKFETVEEVEAWRSSRTRLEVEVHYLSDEFPDNCARRIQELADQFLIDCWDGEAKSRDRFLVTDNLPSKIKMVEDIIEASKKIVSLLSRGTDEIPTGSGSKFAYYESEDSEYLSSRSSDDSSSEDLDDFIVSDDYEETDDEYIQE